MITDVDIVGATTASELVFLVTDGRVSPELSGLYRQFGTLIQDSGVAIFSDDITNLLNDINANRIDPTQVIDILDDLIRTYIDDLLSVVGISVQDGVPLQTLYTLAFALLTFDTGANAPSIKAIVDASEDDYSCICEILEFLTALDVDTWIEVVDTVDHRLYLRAKEVSDVELDTPVLTDSTRNERLRVLIKEAPGTLGARLAEEQVGSMSLEHLYASYIDDFMGKTVEHAVNDLYSLGALSNESATVLPSRISNLLDDLYPEHHMRIQASVASQKCIPVYDKIF